MKKFVKFSRIPFAKAVECPAIPPGPLARQWSSWALEILPSFEI